MNSADYNQRLLKQVVRIRDSEQEYARCIHAWVEAERSYKRATAIALLHVEDAKNVVEREAKAELAPLAGGGTVNDLRYAAHLAEGLMDAAKLAVRNRASELSALQSEASLSRAEAEFAKYEPRETAVA
jgi:hypothetical protein